MQRVLNHSTNIPLTQCQQKLNPHIERMNADGWELMSAAPINIGIEEVFVLFWRKIIEEVINVNVKSGTGDGRPG